MGTMVPLQIRVVCNVVITRSWSGWNHNSWDVALVLEHCFVSMTHRETMVTKQTMRETSLQHQKPMTSARQSLERQCHHGQRRLQLQLPVGSVVLINVQD